MEAAVEASVPLVAEDSLGVDGLTSLQCCKMVLILFEPCEIDGRLLLLAAVAERVDGGVAVLFVGLLVNFLIGGE